MKCITILNKYKYVSGAQEKVSRVFGAPKSFYNSLACISKLNNDEDTLKELPVGATVPVLGLSNKAVYDGNSFKLNDLLSIIFYSVDEQLLYQFLL